MPLPATIENRILPKVPEIKVIPRATRCWYTIHRWIENIQEFRPDDPLHDLKHLKGYPNHQKSVFGKISDDHGATYDFKVYEGETDAAGRAHGEGRWVYDQ